MIKLLRVLGIVVAMFATIDRASALSFTAAGPSEYYTITNLSLFSLTGNVIFSPGSSGMGSSVFTTSSFALLTGQSSTQLVTGLSTGGIFHTTFNGGGSGTPTVFSEIVSPVPLPAGLPLFAMALLALGFVGYYRIRTKSESRDQLVSA